LLKSVARREVDLVAAWSVDRLGRSLTDLLDFLRELHAKGVDLFLHQQGLDTSTPSGRAMFQMMGVFAEFERAMIRERVLAGLARAKEQGVSLGRRRLEDCDAAKVTAIKTALATKTGVRQIARDLKTGVGTVLRIKSARECGPRIPVSLKRCLGMTNPTLAITRTSDAKFPVSGSLHHSDTLRSLSTNGAVISVYAVTSYTPTP
jgi:DNA invertase Pin-like site-specific DNA recombinase